MYQRPGKGDHAFWGLPALRLGLLIEQCPAFGELRFVDLDAARLQKAGANEAALNRLGTGGELADI